MRITLQYGMGKGAASSFFDWLIKNLEEGKQTPLFIDQYSTPTYVIDTAKGIEIAALKSEKGRVYHLASPERIDRYSFGIILASVFNLKKSLCVKSLMRDIKLLSPRPKDVSLNGQRYVNTFKFQPRSVYEGLKAMAFVYESSK